MSVIRCRKCKEDNCNGCNIYTLAELLENRSIKIVSNVVEVIRCKDCKHGREFVDANGLHYRVCSHPFGYGMMTENNGFCKWSERREDGEHEYTMEEYMYGQDLGDPEDGSL